MNEEEKTLVNINPFNEDLLNKNLFVNTKIKKALDTIDNNISIHNGFTLVLGPEKSGKTTLLEIIKQKYNDDFKIIEINSIDFSKDIYSYLKNELLNENDRIIKADLIEIFRTYSKYHSDRIILLIDDIEKLSDDIINQLTYLYNIQTKDNERAIEVICTSVPNFLDYLDNDLFKLFKNRITSILYLDYLTKQEIKRYFKFRVIAASDKENPIEIFVTDEAFNMIEKVTQGIIEKIDILFKQTINMLLSFNTNKITPTIIQRVLKDKNINPKNPLKFFKLFGIIIILIVISIYAINFSFKNIEDIQTQENKKSDVRLKPIKYKTLDYERKNLFSVYKYVPYDIFYMNDVGENVTHLQYFLYQKYGDIKITGKYSYTTKSAFLDYMKKLNVRYIKRNKIKFKSNITTGAYGLPVKLIQYKLYKKGFIKSIRFTTGYYGPLTKRAVIRFQKKYRLKQSGVVDHKTFKKLL